MDIDKLKHLTKKLKVLFVEDSLSVRKITQKMLSQFFEHIDAVEDGEIALDMYRNFYNKNEEFYDVVFTDLDMPNMDGKELSKLIIDFNPAQEIVVMSGVNDFKVLISLINIGVKKFIAKPAQIEELQKVVEEVASNIRTRKLKEDDAQEILEYNEHLKQREEEYKEMLESKVKELQEFSNALDLSAIVAKTDPKGSITYINKEFCDICGYSEEELIGQNHRILSSGKRSSSYYKKLYNRLHDKKQFKTIFENKRKDGSTYFVETIINPIVNVDDEVVEFIAFSHDMTQLMTSIENTRLAQKSKEDFFINISHEMKTPLNSILGFASILQKRVQDDQKSLIMVNTIQETGNDLNKLVESIIDMRKIQEGTFVLSEFSFNPREELEKSLEKYLQKAQEKNIAYKSKIDASLPDLLIGDIVRINQVISIVVDNAIKFTDDGGKVLVALSYDKFTKLLHCDVQDNGIGISKKNQSKIFGIEQLDSSTTRSYEGTGIGLNIASSIIKIMKGQIKLKSIPSKGSLFSIEFPVST